MEMPLIISLVILFSIAEVSTHQCAMRLERHYWERSSRINCYSKNLTAVPFFGKIGETLSEIDLTYNSIRGIPAGAFMNIKTRKLCLYSNKIQRLSPDAFEGLEDTLEVLLLGWNNMTEVPSRSLANMTKLTWLQLSNNNINSVKKEFSKIGRFIKRLELESNELSRFPLRAADLPMLEELNLKENKISNLHGFGYHLKLRKLILNWNNFDRVPKFNKYVPRLQELFLNGNNIRHIRANSFKGLRLTSLSIGDQNIDLITKNAFRGLESSLVSLWISSANLTSFPYRSIKGLRRLKYLYLQNNRIQSIKLSTLRYFPKLYYLGLEGNELTEIPVEPLKQAGPTLREVNLAKNKIRSIPWSFTNMTQLTRMYLNHNQLTTIPARAFYGLDKMILDVRFNNIHVLDPCLMNAKTPTMVLDGNPLHCDCTVYWLAYAGKINKQSVNLRCSSPEIVQGKSLKNIPWSFWRCSKYDREKMLRMVKCY
ncbi:unnamed protein product [Owenia fusiformis]|uniref:Uncharacterized protein n=1 Tax=Owenia fusiformis TaxID=6347 RepID=A0A8S4NXZ2_OWEFU|nr:unnamed protein product [Owenia fusiformis]